MNNSTVIIGGGIIGASVAYHLAKLYSVKDIVVLEKSRLGSGSTSASLGGFRHQFSNETAIRLSKESVKVIDEFEKLFGYDPLVKKDGYCFIASNEESLKSLQRNKDLARSLGINVELLSSEELKLRFPFYSFDGILGGTLTKEDGHASTFAVLQGLVSMSKNLGVKFYEHAEVTGIKRSDEKVMSVITSSHEFEAAKVVIAAGAYSGNVGKLVGIDVPIRPYPRKILVTDSFSDSIPIEIPIIVDVDTTLSIGREGKGVIFADNEPTESSFELSFPQDYDERVIAKAVNRVPSLSRASIAYADVGLYEMTPDSNPIVSEVKQVEGLYCCSGFAGHGFMHSIAIGNVMAEIMMGQRTHIDVSEYDIQRFDQGMVRAPEKLII